MGYIGKIQDTAGNTQLVGSTLFGTCDTAAATMAKIVTCADFSELVTGVTIHVRFTNSHSATSMSLNVNNTGTIQAVRAHPNSSFVSINGPAWVAGAVVSFTYDGTYWVLNDNYYEDTNTDYKVLQQDTVANYEYPILVKNTWNTTAETDQVKYARSGNVTLNPSTGTITTTNLNAANEINGLQIETASDGSFSFVNGDTLGGFLEVPGGAEYTLGSACTRTVDTSINSGSPSTTNVPTSYAVTQYVAGAVSGANAFQGTLVANGTPSSGTWDQADIEAASYAKGWYWVCSAAGTYCGKVLEAGDMLFCVESKGSGSYSASHFNAVQNNIETLTNGEIDTEWTNAVAVTVS